MLDGAGLAHKTKPASHARTQMTKLGGGEERASNEIVLRRTEEWELVLE